MDRAITWTPPIAIGRLAKFNGVPGHTFYLQLKETEFRFNHRRGNLYQAVLKPLRDNPIQAA